MATTTDRDKTQEQIRQKQQAVIDIRCAFSNPASDIADYKVARIYEARLNGEADPFVASDLLTARKAAREKISTLNEEIAKLGGATVAAETKAEKLNALDTAYDRSKNQLFLAFLGAVMADNTDLQTELKAELKELDAQYDTDRKAAEGSN